VLVAETNRDLICLLVPQVLVAETNRGQTETIYILSKPIVCSNENILFIKTLYQNNFISDSLLLKAQNITIFIRPKRILLLFPKEIEKNLDKKFKAKKENEKKKDYL
jgi:hypothetical protein